MKDKCHRNIYAIYDLKDFEPNDILDINFSVRIEDFVSFPYEDLIYFLNLCVKDYLKERRMNNGISC